MKVHGKRILSAFLALVMVVGLLPATAMAADIGTSANPIVVYRNPNQDPAGTSFSTKAPLEVVSKFYAREATRDAWEQQIIAAMTPKLSDPSKAASVKYHVDTFEKYGGLNEVIAASFVYGSWFAWDSVKGKVANVANTATNNIGKESRVAIFDSDGKQLTNDFYVKAKGYVDIVWDIGNGDTYADKVSLDYAINNAESDFDSADTDYAAAVTAAKAYATELSKGGCAWTFDGFDTDDDGDYDVDDEAYLATRIDVTDAYKTSAYNMIFGWQETSTDEEPLIANEVEGKTFTAVYTTTITWVNDDGTVLETDKNVAYGTKPTYDGTTPVAQKTEEGKTYTFNGWNPRVEETVANVAKYTATYTETTNKYTITWEVGDGTWSDGTTADKTTSVEYGKIPVAPETPVKSEDATHTYSFGGWDTELKALTDADNDGKIDNPTVYTAAYTPTPKGEVTVTFMVDGNVYGDSQTIIKGNAIAEPATPEKTHYSFTKWYSDAACTREYDFSAAVNTNITLYAGWSENAKATVSFNVDGAAYDAQTIYVGCSCSDCVIDWGKPTKNGYQFDGWYADAGYKNAFTAPSAVETNIDVYGRWLAMYTVNFDANDGEGVMESQTFVQTQNQALTMNAFTKKHHTFLGWSTNKDAVTPDYTDGQSIAAEGNMTLYAVWQKIDATRTVIKTEVDNAVVTYGEFETAEQMAAALMAQFKPYVTFENGGKIEGTVTIQNINEIFGHDAGTCNVTLFYGGNGDENYAGATETVTVTINKAAAMVVVSSQTVKYGQTLADPFKANCNTIDVLAGLDVHDETYLVGTVQAAMPEELLIAFAFAAKGAGIDDISDLSVADLKKLVNVLSDNSNPQIAAIADKIIEYKDSLNKLIATLEKIQDELPMESELKISVVSEIKLSANIGVYLAASLASDKNYEAVNANDGLDAGYLIITPNGIKAELSWNENDDNHIITLDKYADFDLGATAKVIESTVEGANKTDKVEDHLEYIFIGVDGNGELLLKCITDTAEMKNAAIGAYAQVAYVANWDNVMYYAEPIARPIVIAPNVADVVILDGNGNENYAQVFTYDGDAKAVKVTVDGVENAEGLTVKYIGSDTTVDGWYRTEAPTDAGVYTVVATYTEKNDAGELVKAGGAVGVLIIEPADADITMPDAEYKYDGAEHFPKLTEGFDFVTVAIDREDNVAYVNLPEDTADHIDRIVTMMPAEVENELRAFLEKYENFDGEAQTSAIKAELSAIIDKAIAVDMTAKAEAMAEKLVDKLAEELKNNQDIDTLVEKIKTEIAALEDAIRNEIPEPLEDYIRDIVTVTENGVDIDLEKAKADIKAMIDKVKGELPAPVVAELYEMVDELTKAIEDNVDVKALEDKATQIVEELKALEVADAEALVKAVIGAIYNNLDMTQIQSLLDQVVAKVEARGYVDYLKNMVKAISGMYESKINTTEVEKAIDDLIAKIEEKIESGDIDADDLAGLEKYVDAILTSLKSVVEQIPDGTVIFGKNPTEVGEYDCYAMNISANYKWEFVESKMKIYYEITFDANGGTVDPSTGKTGADAKLTELPTPTRDGYTFNGWYTAATGGEKVTLDKIYEGNTTIYAQWTKNSTGGNTGGGGGSSRPDIEDPNITGVVNYLNTDDHFPFMVGDDKGTFRPNANITRAEVAQVFYALLKDKNVTITAGFDDVEEGIWYETAVNTLASMGIVAGVGDGKFEPERPITRAEFAAIAAKFAKKSYTGMKFDDVSEDHWAYPGICTAASYGWVTGIGDNKFGPMQKITRAEVATIVNHMLGRLGDWDAIDNGEGRWFPDVTKSHWAWYEIAEATTDHNYKFNQKRTEETWSKSKPNPPMQ